MERAQIIFLIPFSAVTLSVLVFGVYVAWSTMWGDRWYRKRQ